MQRCPFCSQQKTAVMINDIIGMYHVFCSPDHGGCGAITPPNYYEADALADWESGEIQRKEEIA